MVNTQIPTHYTGSPSSLSTTPFLTINHDATDGLDSSNAFEGPEKLLEVWFSPSSQTLPPTASPNGLKSVSAETWKGMLDLVNCQVLSTIESEHVDAYLLSESSMFVFPHKLVLKTCGTTTLLLGLPRMLEIAATEAGFPSASAKKSASAKPHRVFYSRKNFLFPDKQQGPHRSWRDEVHYLDRTFPGGSAYMIGKMNGEHWYLYITSPSMELTPPQTPDEQQTSDRSSALTDLDRIRHLSIDSTSDETLEILMTDLDEDNAKQFYLEHAQRIANGAQNDISRNAHSARKSDMGQMNSIPEDTRVNHTSPLLSGTSDSTFDVFAKNSLELPEAATGGTSSTTTSAATASTSSDTILSEGHMLGQAVSQHCGLADIYPPSKYPDAKIDAYLFTPCGFSANAVIPSASIPDPPTTSSSTTTSHTASPPPSNTHYFTVHVTPEPACSYASFETNVPTSQTGRETADIVAQVVSIFRPGRFSVTLFEAKDKRGSDAQVLDKRAQRSMDEIEGYRRVDRVLHDLEGYELVFRHFEKVGWEGGRPRIAG